MAAGQVEPGARLLLVGDVLLARQVAREVALTGRSPWEPFRELFRSAGWVAGNLEGAVAGTAEAGGSKGEPCGPVERAPCFATSKDLVPLLSDAGFSALGLANNHASDLGEAGRERTRAALRVNGLVPLELESSPHVVRLRGGGAGIDSVVAVVAVNLVKGRDGAADAVPSEAVLAKLRLARAAAPFTLVFVHWGAELLDWPSAAQRAAAAWLVASGASAVIGHHPHVVQEPECVGGRPVFFSLGNHLFDQKYEATKTGLVADCRVESGLLTCSALETRTPAGSSFPALGGARPPLPCAVPAASAAIGKAASP